jgi:hypothetical protein
MISTFSKAGYLIRRSPQPRSCIFQQSVLEGEIDDDLFQRGGLGAQVFHLGTVCLPDCVSPARRLFPFGMTLNRWRSCLTDELLRSTEIAALGDPLSSVQFGSAVLVAQSS